MDKDWRNAFGILMCTEIYDGAGAGICDGSPSTCYSFFLFLHKNIRCGYSLEAPRRGASNEYPQRLFSWRNKKNIYLDSHLIWCYDYTWAVPCVKMYIYLLYMWTVKIQISKQSCTV